MSSTVKPRSSVTVESKSSTWDSRFNLMKWWNADRIKEATVMVVGAGALGNEIIKNLTLLGVGNLLIIDLDTVDYTNLSRSILFRAEDCDRKKNEVAAERVRSIHPGVRVATLDGDIGVDIGLGVFRRMDVIIGGLDNRLARLAINRACYKVGKTWVDGAIQDMGGQVAVYKPGKTCYECNLTPQDRKQLSARLSCISVARQHAELGTMATTPIAASIIGAIQAQEALKVIFGDGDRRGMIEEDFYYEGRSNYVAQRKYPILKQNCPSHHTYSKIIEAPLSASDSVAKVLDWITNHLEDDDPAIILERPLVFRFATEKTQIVTDLMVPHAKMDNKFVRKYEKQVGEGLAIIDSIDQLERCEERILDQTLLACGIPFFHILPVLTTEGKYHYIELSADADKLTFK
ncbi:ThiF family adenylyltransferase [Lewinella sp. W8]|uniref:HesA/MoeB/ThiF family protein n=1 Tax=Lewinella sp. W8 TaxID=2528208 RepID=UPI001067E123|nr:ThiF family adenylyltransferase [Lewinella sp. W8]MTB52931.1 hypothetical protein [Lewinella sp. W8]